MTRGHLYIKVSWTAKKYLNIPMTAFLHCEPSIGWVSGTNHYYAGLAQWLTHTSPHRMPIVGKNIHRVSSKIYIGCPKKYTYVVLKNIGCPMQMHIHRVTALIIIMPAWFNGSRIPHIPACLSSAKCTQLSFGF